MHYRTDKQAQKARDTAFDNSMTLCVCVCVCAYPINGYMCTWVGWLLSLVVVASMSTGTLYTCSIIFTHTSINGMISGKVCEREDVHENVETMLQQPTWGGGGGEGVVWVKSTNSNIYHKLYKWFQDLFPHPKRLMSTEPPPYCRHPSDRVSSLASLEAGLATPDYWLAASILPGNSREGCGPLS